MTTKRNFQAQVEDYYPITLGLMAGVACAIWGGRAFAFMNANEWNVAVIYSSVFGLMTVFTGFLFTFFSFFITTERGFIGRAKGSRPYKQTVRFSQRTLALGGLVIAITIPMMVVEPTPTVFGIGLIAVAWWLFFTIWALASFFRAAHVFSIFASQHI